MAPPQLPLDSPKPEDLVKMDGLEEEINEQLNDQEMTEEINNGHDEMHNVPEVEEQFDQSLDGQEDLTVTCSLGSECLRNTIPYWCQNHLMMMMQLSPIVQCPGRLPNGEHCFRDYHAECITARLIRGGENRCSTCNGILSDFNNDELPEPKTILDTSVEAVNLVSEQNAKEAYDEHMKKTFTSTLSNFATLQSLCQAAETVAFEIFSVRPKFGEESVAKVNKDNLAKYFATRHAEYKRTVEQNLRMEEEKRRVEAEKKRIAAEQEAKRLQIKAEEERIRREKAENERRQREEAERQRQEAERLRRQREEQERRHRKEQNELLKQGEQLAHQLVQVVIGAARTKIKQWQAVYRPLIFNSCVSYSSPSYVTSGSSSGEGSSDGVREVTFHEKRKRSGSLPQIEDRFCKKPFDW